MGMHGLHVLISYPFDHAMLHAPAIPWQCSGTELEAVWIQTCARSANALEPSPIVIDSIDRAQALVT
eukprot:11029805-Karenia_brevis.AAC.1